MTNTKDKDAVCIKFQESRQEMRNHLIILLQPRQVRHRGHRKGFTIGMVIPRIENINSEAEDAEIACMQAVLADRNNNPGEFSLNLKQAGTHIREMQRIYPELAVVSDDFKPE